MMYLIKKNDKYLVMASDIETIRKYCGLDARIMFAWEEDEQSEALKTYFSRIRMEKDIIDLCAVSGITRKEVNTYIDRYYDENEVMLSSLTDIEVITSEEKEELSNISEESKKRQMDVVTECYYGESVRKHIR